MVHTIATCQLKIIWNLIQEHSGDNYRNNYEWSSAEKLALNPSGLGKGGGGTPDIQPDRDDQRISFGNFRFRDSFG